VDVFGPLGPLEGVFFQHVPGGVGGFLMFAVAVGVGIALLAWHRVTSGDAPSGDPSGEDEQ
jgi:hypothetical protein